jgi:diacylglycerol kinase (CTP)
MKRLAEAKLGHVLASGFQFRLAMRNDLHLLRKTWHLGMGMFIIFIYLFTGMSVGTAVLCLGSALGLDLIIETARLRIPAFNEQVLRYWGPVMRSCEVNKVSGTPYYLLASLLALSIFPKPVGVLSVLFLAVGDPIASLVGILYGKNSIRVAQGKSLIGTLAGVAACTLTTLVFLKAYPMPVSDSAWIALSLIGGVAGGTAELAPFDMDDNFTIPMISGFVMWLAFIAFGV